MPRGLFTFPAPGGFQIRPHRWKAQCPANPAKPLNENQERVILVGLGDAGSNSETRTTIMGAKLRLPSFLSRSTQRWLYGLHSLPCRKMAERSSRVTTSSTRLLVTLSSSCGATDRRIVVFFIGTCEKIAYTRMRRAGFSAKAAPLRKKPFVPARGKGVRADQRTACTHVILITDGIH